MSTFFGAQRHELISPDKFILDCLAVILAPSKSKFFTSHPIEKNKEKYLIAEKPIDDTESIHHHNDDVSDNIQSNRQLSLESMLLKKCIICGFESIKPSAFKKHLNSIIQCSKCSEAFCGFRAKQQHTRHEYKHSKREKPKKEHVCSYCKKSFPFASKLKRHQIKSVCGRKIYL